MASIISTPLIFPKVEPSDWNRWWEIWFKNSKILPKVVMNHNQGSTFWTGFDIFVEEGVNSSEISGYEAEFVSCGDIFSDLFKNLDKLPIKVKVIRAVSSRVRVPAHTDWRWKEFSIRSLLYDNNVFDNFYYDLGDGNKIYQRLPPESNTWGYWDHKGKHGSDFYQGHSKILMMYFGPTKLDINLDQSIERYKDYVIYDKYEM
jgi:hypothetical protein